MLSTIEAVNSVVNNFIWGVPAMICIVEQTSCFLHPHQQSEK